MEETLSVWNTNTFDSLSPSSFFSLLHHHHLVHVVHIAFFFITTVVISRQWKQYCPQTFQLWWFAVENVWNVRLTKTLFICFWFLWRRGHLLVTGCVHSENVRGGWGGGTSEADSRLQAFGLSGCTNIWIYWSDKSCNNLEIQWQK